MNKRAAGGILMDNVIYIILLLIFCVLMYFFISGNANGASIYEDYYAKEIVKIIDAAKPGDDFAIDVSQATIIAQKNKVADFEEIFSFNNLKNEICVKLSRGLGKCFKYFNDVSIQYDETEKWIHYAEPVNRLHFVVKEGFG